MTVTICKRGHPRTSENAGPRGRCRACDRERSHDPEYRAKQYASARKRYAADPEYRARKLAYAAKNRDQRRHSDRERARYAADPEYRAKRRAQAKAYDERVKADPKALDRKRERQRIWANGKSRREGKPERQWTERSGRGGGRLERIDPGPFLAWVDRWMAVNPDVPLYVLAKGAGSSTRTIRQLRSGEYKTLQLGVVVRYLDAAGEEPHVLHALYPLVDSADVSVDLSVPKHRQRVVVVCCSHGCHESPGHGYGSYFCRPHAEILERIRVAFEADEAAKRERRWTTDALDYGETEVLA